LDKRPKILPSIGNDSRKCKTAISGTIEAK